jgi:GNAT superfamily N-acetyltransferase
MSEQHNHRHGHGHAHGAPAPSPRCSGTRVRRARPRDCRDLTRIAYGAKRSWRYPEKLIRLWKGDLTIGPEFLIRHPVYCAARGTRVVGFYAISGTGAERELEHMWVDPQHIGTGVGRVLFTHLLKQLRSLGVRRLRVASDPNAEGFYRAMGCRRVGRVPAKPAGRSLPLLVFRLEQGAELDARPRVPTRGQR